MGSLMNAFIVRPFGIRSGIDFDKVQTDLIEPALARFEIRGGTTGKILEAGNIREDMFQQLLVADLVIADVSLHNANVFYELGIRHALRPRRTYLLRARQEKPRQERGPEDEVPFDLRTDRYLEYDPKEPAGILSTFIDALNQTLLSDRQDSPVFRLLPDLQAQDRARFLPVPLKFREDVELASKKGQIGILGLLGLEAGEFPWASEGLRLVGRAQFSWKAYAGARATWEAVSRLDPLDVESNLLLGTIYQRLLDLDASDQALQRVSNNKQATRVDRAEAFSLLGRNIKDRWKAAWQQIEGEQRSRYALRSPSLLQAFDKYRQGFEEDLNSFYPGLNALSLLTIGTELAKKMPDLWEARFQSSSEAERELNMLVQQRQALAGAVGISLNAAKKRSQQSGGEDRWLAISLADYLFLTSDRPAAVQFEYESALAGAATFHVDSARSQLLLFDRLNLWSDKVSKALDGFPQLDAHVPSEPPAPPDRVIFFTGHMIDPAGRKPPRFPKSCEEIARQAIGERLQQEIERTKGKSIGIAGAACGSDILFHEVCAEMGIPHDVFLPLPIDRFRTESVSPAGKNWEERFDQLMRQFPSPHVLSHTEDLPSWLSLRPNYNAWQRANLWLIQEALAVGGTNITLLALWDGKTGDGPGGTDHMIRVAAQHGAATVILDTNKLFEGYIRAHSESQGLS
jgi:tetratricopeptide repeat protein